MSDFQRLGRPDCPWGGKGKTSACRIIKGSFDPRHLTRTARKAGELFSLPPSLFQNAFVVRSGACGLPRGVRRNVVGRRDRRSIRAWWHGGQMGSVNRAVPSGETKGLRGGTVPGFRQGAACCLLASPGPCEATARGGCGCVDQRRRRITEDGIGQVRPRCR